MDLSRLLLLAALFASCHGDEGSSMQLRWTSSNGSRPHSEPRPLRYPAKQSNFLRLESDSQSQADSDKFSTSDLTVTTNTLIEKYLTKNLLKIKKNLENVLSEETENEAKLKCGYKVAYDISLYLLYILNNNFLWNLQ